MQRNLFSESQESRRWYDLLPDVDSDQLLVTLNEALAEYKKTYEMEGKSCPKALLAIVKACDAYIMQIPRQRRDRWDDLKSWEQMLPEWPHIMDVLNIQKKAVAQLYLPKAKTDTQARIKLLQSLVLDNIFDSSSAGKMLEKEYWPEIKYDGRVAYANWVMSIGYTNIHELRASHEVVDDEKAKRGIGVENVAYQIGSLLETHLRINIEQGLLYRNNKLVNTSGSATFNTKFDIVDQDIYVVSRDGKIYAVNPDALDNIHHSSFLKGRRVLCAGGMKVMNGKIKLITNDSGHYKPTNKQLVDFLRLLKDEYKVDLTDIKVIDQSGFPKNAERYLNNNGFCLPDDVGAMIYAWTEELKNPRTGKIKDLEKLHIYLDTAADLGKNSNAQFVRATFQIMGKNGYDDSNQGFITLQELRSKDYMQYRIDDFLSHLNQVKDKKEKEMPEKIKHPKKEKVASKKARQNKKQEEIVVKEEHSQTRHRFTGFFASSIQPKMPKFGKVKKRDRRLVK